MDQRATFVIGTVTLLSLLFVRKWRDSNRSTSGFAKVYLVGAGPGATDLITVRGLNVLSRADVVLNDRLVSPELLTYCKKDCVILNVGKSSEKERFSQKELEKELIKAAKDVGKGGVVVRLKGGDPYVYGLGASEGLVLNEAGIEWEYVPGLSSATSLPGLCLTTPLTHKGVSSGFIVLSGHVAPTSDSEWGQLPRTTHPQLTLVVIMCAKNLQAITDYLRLELGWNPNIPAAVIQSGSTAEERTLRSSLDSIADDAIKYKIDEAPLALVVGECLNVLKTSSTQLSHAKVNEKLPVWGSARLNEVKRTDKQDWWVFGYGSLVWKSGDIPHTDVEDGYVEGYIRRFWQSSPDHRGTEEKPGRVVTILPIDIARRITNDPSLKPEKVFGRVFRVDPEKIEETYARLLHREKAGYEERTVDVLLKGGGIIRASVFLGLPENEHFAGPASVTDIAKKIMESVGPSGQNLEYFDELFTALSEMQIRWGETDRVVDAHILELANAISVLRKLCY